MQKGRIHSHLKRRAERVRRDERGISMVEFSITFPIFFFLIFAIIDFSQVIAQRTIISDAVRVAGRKASLDSSKFTADCATTAHDAFNVTRAKSYVPGKATVTGNDIYREDSNVFTAPTDDTLIASDHEIQVRGLRVVVNAEVRCDFFCTMVLNGIHLIRGGNSKLPFVTSGIFPLEYDIDPKDGYLMACNS